ncbi:acyl-homoserine-lactone synthase [Seohaeicola nanhaiensis]|uniref:Acyl-homoserine-lactone synthase n=1 Tax=Seohaeicola nanhaiensis TaxID=1387282 RepID=A0ABV9KLY6_9RHOB
MLRYLYADQLGDFPTLAHSMFTDRADQFARRMGWPVTVDAQGEERDVYDSLNPLYVIWEQADGLHGGSMRFLPTTGRVMVNDVFADLAGGAISSPLIWECTRFCLGQEAGPRVAAALMLGGGEIMARLGVRHFVGVFDARMVRIYRAIGASPEVLGSRGSGRDQVSVGLWSFTEAARNRVARRARISPELSRLWFERSFGTPRPLDRLAGA